MVIKIVLVFYDGNYFLQAIDKALIKKSDGGFTYAGVYNYGSVEKKMEHLVSVNYPLVYVLTINNTTGIFATN